MGAVLGITAYGRTQEKMAGANNGGLGNNGLDLSQGFGTGTTYVPPNATTVNNITQGSGVNNGSPTMGGTPSFGSPSATSPTTGKPTGPALSFPVI
jgi:hypothetical protein